MKRVNNSGAPTPSTPYVTPLLIKELKDRVRWLRVGTDRAVPLLFLFYSYSEYDYYSVLLKSFIYIRNLSYSRILAENVVSLRQIGARQLQTTFFSLYKLHES